MRVFLLLVAQTGVGARPSLLRRLPFAPVAQAEPGSHPMVGISSSTLAGLRTYISTYQDSTIEALLTVADANWSRSCAAAHSCAGNDLGSGAMNAAFWRSSTVMTIGSVRRARCEPAGYADFDTPAELCAIAHSYLDTDGNGSNGLGVGITLREQFDAIVDTKTVRAAEDVEGHSFEGNSATHSFYFTVPRVHDWCYAWLTTMERDDLEDSFETFTMASACEVDAAYKQPIRIRRPALSRWAQHHRDRILSMISFYRRGPI